MTIHPMVLARLGEITLKGLNRGRFEQRLMSNLRRRLKSHGNFTVSQAHSRIWVDPQDEDAVKRIPEAIEICSTIFGLVSSSPVWRIEGSFDYETLEEGALAFVREYRDRYPRHTTFRVDTRRGNKQFPMTSPEINRELGHVLLESDPGLKVDLHEPEFTLHVEVRDTFYVYTEIVPGVRGLPVGTSGRSMLLLSGGIDSPVAGYMMASRGIELDAIYFHTFPYTSDRAKEKVITLATLLADFCGRIRLHVVDFTDIQMELKANVPDDMMTVVMRRIMFRIAEDFARENHIYSLITGESVGQVASQTSEAIACTDAVVNCPVYRPLIGLDKDDTIATARRIGTFETSILPYEDCCTVFVSKHPRTRPSLRQAKYAESKLDVDALVKEGVEKIDTITIGG